MEAWPMKVIVPHRPVHIAVFLLLAFLCYQAHQLTRHITGAILCGGPGSMTFTVATTRQPCVLPTLLTLSGPLLTYGLAWSGMFLLRSQKYALFAYALIFASFSHLRWIQNLTGRGDELVQAQQWFRITSQALVTIVVFLIGLPPVVAAFRAIGNRHRLRVFAGSWLLPLPLLFVMLFGNHFLFEVSDAGTRAGAVLGIWTTVFVTDLIAAAVLIIFGIRYRIPRQNIQHGD